MKPDGVDQAPLLPHGAFVVQFRAGTGMVPGRCAGRVEHMASGQATRFGSQEELWAFTVQILIGVQAEQPKVSGEE